MENTQTQKDFLALNQEAESEPQWVFKTDEELKILVAEFLGKNWDSFDQFLASKRKQAFSLTTKDGVVVTDPNQWVWIINPQYGVRTCSIELAKERYGDNFWSTPEAAHTYLRQSSRVFSLRDMEFKDGSYYIFTGIVDEILNERLK